jgi:hypothetical protein
MQVFVMIPSGKILTFEFIENYTTIGELKESVNWKEETEYKFMYLYKVLLHDDIKLSFKLFGDKCIEIK